jgi:CelD/BcsL family acetyltransferase involved in cellulose biosynthesis
LLVGKGRWSRPMPRIIVNVRPHARDAAAQWEELAARAAPNVFMHPAALNAVHAAKFAKLHVLLAWDADAEPQRLVGLWALRERRIAPLLPAFLAAPPYDYAFVSSPVVDPAHMDEVMAAFLAAIARDPALPNVVRLKYLDGECETYAPIMRALAARGSETLQLSERARPFASKAFGLKHSGSTRKKLRQDWNRLGALGAVDIVNAREPGGVRAAFELFLALEAGSWKGARGTALLSKKADAAFARRLLGDLAGSEAASVALLRVDGRSIAAQVLLYCGGTAYTWKTAFDAGFAKYSPGALLVDKMTEQLFAAGIEAIESCSPDGSFMAQLWAGRRATVDLLVDVGSRKSLGFALAALGERGYARLREARNRLRAVPWLAARRKAAVVAR